MHLYLFINYMRFTCCIWWCSGRRCSCYFAGPGRWWSRTWQCHFTRRGRWRKWVWYWLACNHIFCSKRTPFHWRFSSFAVFIRVWVSCCSSVLRFPIFYTSSPTTLSLFLTAYDFFQFFFRRVIIFKHHRRIGTREGKNKTMLSKYFYQNLTY